MSIIIIYGLHVFCSSVALRASAFLALKTLLGKQKIVRQWDRTNPPAISQMSATHPFSLLFYFLNRKARFAIPTIISRYNASQSPVNCAGNVCLSYYVTHCLHRKARQTTSANRFTVIPNLGYHTDARNML